MVNKIKNFIIKLTNYKTIYLFILLLSLLIPKTILCAEPVYSESGPVYAESGPIYAESEFVYAEQKLIETKKEQALSNHYQTKQVLQDLQVSNHDKTLIDNTIFEQNVTKKVSVPVEIIKSEQLHKKKSSKKVSNTIQGNQGNKKPAQLVVKNKTSKSFQKVQKIDSNFNENFEKELILSILRQWARKWSELDVNAYLSFYAPNFQPSKGMSRKKWEKLRRKRLNKKFINIKILNPVILFQSDSVATVKFKQIYHSNNYKCSDNKRIIFQKRDKYWYIIREEVL